jgi:hypothetical protein
MLDPLAVEVFLDFGDGATIADPLLLPFEPIALAFWCSRRVSSAVVF